MMDEPTSLDVSEMSELADRNSFYFSQPPTIEGPTSSPEAETAVSPDSTLTSNLNLDSFQSSQTSTTIESRLSISIAATTFDARDTSDPTHFEITQASHSGTTSELASPQRSGHDKRDRLEFSQIPPEVVIMCLKNLRKPDLSSFRLASKNLAEICTPVLFRSVRVMFTVESFKNMRHISNNVLLNRCVKRIIYEAFFLEDTFYLLYTTRNRRLATLRRRLLEAHSAVNTGIDVFEAELSESLDKGWKAYQVVLEEQKHMRTINMDYTAFAQAILRFSNLTTIEIPNYRYHLERVDSSSTRVYRETKAIDANFLIAHTPDEGSGIRAAKSTMVSITTFPTLIKRFRINTLDWAFFDPVPRAMNFVLPFFSQLNHVSLSFKADSIRGFQSRDFHIARHTELAMAVRSATALEYLSLHLGGDTSQFQPDRALQFRQTHVLVNLETIFGDMTWPKLHTLSLSGVTAEYESITSLFGRHTATLKVLKLRMLWLRKSSEGWESVFDMCQSQLNLTRVALRGIWGVGSDSGTQKTLRMNGDWVEKLCKALTKKEKICYEELIPATAYAIL